MDDVDDVDDDGVGSGGEGAAARARGAKEEGGTIGSVFVLVEPTGVKWNFLFD